MGSPGLIVRLARAVIRLATPAWARDALIGDLDEEWNSVARERGSARASAWYLLQALLLAARYAGERRRRDPSTATLTTFEEARMNPLSHVHHVFQDLRLAGRQVLAQPGFWVPVILTLGLAIGFNAAIFALVNAVLFKPLARDNPDRVVRLYAQSGQRGSSPAFSYLDLQLLRNGGTALIDVAGVHQATLVLTDRGTADQLLAEVVSGGYFELLGIDLALGRGLAASDDAASATPVAVISEYYWRNRLGADPSIVGRTVSLSGRAFTVIGVATSRFRGSFVGGNVDVWVPLDASLPLLGQGVATDGTRRPLEILARLRDGVSLAQASASLDAFSSDIARNRGETGGVRMTVVPGTLLHGRPRALAAVFLSLLGAMVGLVLLVAASNVANLLLARTLARRRDMAIRVSIGASRFRIVQQLLAESVVLAAGGLAIGMGASLWVSRAFQSVALLPGFELRLDLTPDRRVFAATAGVALIAGLMATLLPALAASRGNLVPLLREGGASLGSRRTARARNALVVAQVAIAVVVCIAAGLLMKSARAGAAIELGFDRAGIFATDIDLDVHGYAKPRAEVFFRALLERVSAMPGVAHAALANRAPVDSSTPGARVLRDHEDPMTPPGSPPPGIDTSYYVVTPGYLDVVGVPLLAGRAITDADREGAPQVAIANEFLVRALWPGANPSEALGRRLRVAPQAGTREPGPAGEIEIIGVARNAKYRTIGEGEQPHLYVPYAQHRSGSMALLVRSRSGAILATDVQKAIADLDPAVQGFFTRTLTEHTRVSLLPAIFASRVALAVGLVSGALGAIGLYALIACTVAERRREFGLRMALGASSGKVASDVVRQALVLASVGCAAGAAAGFFGTRLLGSLLYGVSPSDPATFATVIAAAALTSVLAAWFPARRAGRVDPILALKT